MSYKLHDEIFNLSQHINKVTRERTASPKMLQMHKILTGRAKVEEGLKLEDRLATIHGKCPEIPSTLRLVDTAQ